MTFLRNNLMLMVGAVVLGAALIGAYYYYFGGSSSDTSLTSTPALSGVSSQDLLSSLGNLQTVKFDTSIFSDPAYQQLIDFSVGIPPQPIGNPDPFAPLPGTVSVAGH